MSHPVYSSQSLVSSLRHEAGEGGYCPVRGEQALWRAVILQALEDAVSNSHKTQDRHAQTQARHWLLGTSADFAQVCDYAGWNPAYVRRQVRRALKNGCKWRAEPGKGARQKKKVPQPLAPQTLPHYSTVIPLREAL